MPSPTFQNTTTSCPAFLFQASFILYAAPVVCYLSQHLLCPVLLFLASFISHVPSTVSYFTQPLLLHPSFLLHASFAPHAPPVVSCLQNTSSLSYHPVPSFLHPKHISCCILPYKTPLVASFLPIPYVLYHTRSFRHILSLRSYRPSLQTHLPPCPPPPTSPSVPALRPPSLQETHRSRVINP